MDAARFKFSQRTARFYENHDAELDINFNENKNTKRKTETDMRIFSSYLISINETREPETISADELDRHLATYFSVIKKHDGNEYEPASLRGMLCSIERYLRTKNYPVSLTRDAEFTNTRNMLKDRQKLLRDLAKTDKGTKSETIAMNTVHRLNQLYLAKEFGPHNPSAVINALCFAFVVYLKIRKAIDHKQLLWGDIVLKMSATNDEYLCYEPLPGYEYCRLPLKGISGFRVLAQSLETSLWDPISIYKLYRHKRPGNMMTPDSPFYLGIAVPIHDSQQQPWFKPVAMGVNKLNDLVRMIRDITGTLVHGPSYSFDTYDVKDMDETERSNNNSDSSKYDDDNVNSIMRTNTSKDTQNPAEEDENDQVGAESKGTEIDADDDFLQTEKKETDSEKQRNGAKKDSMKITGNLVGEAKEKIKSILNDLDFDARSDVIRWLKATVCLAESEGSQTRQRESKKRIRLSIELDDDELEISSCAEKKVKVEIITGSNDTSQTEPVLDRQKAIYSPGHDAANTLSKITGKGKSDSTFYDQTDSLRKMRQYVFKRALSYPNDLKSADISKPQENDGLNGTSTASEQPQASTITAGERKNGHLDSTRTMDTDGEDKATDPVYPVQGYNPYAAWALDPRFAMFMRNGFIQTYQDFVNMYSNIETKDTSSN